MGLFERKIISLFIFYIVLSATPVMAQNSDAMPNSSATDRENIFTQALDAAKDKRFQRAYTLLDNLDGEQKHSFEYHFTKARILTWQQSYPAAEIEYRYLLQTFPNNPDVKVSYGFLELFRGNFEIAETQFNSVLNLFPNYKDAREGIERTQAARHSQIIF